MKSESLCAARNTVPEVARLETALRIADLAGVPPP
jgi:hypothetical protein